MSTNKTWDARVKVSPTPPALIVSATPFNSPAWNWRTISVLSSGFTSPVITAHPSLFLSASMGGLCAENTTSGVSVSSYPSAISSIAGIRDSAIFARTAENDSKSGMLDMSKTEICFFKSEILSSIPSSLSNISEYLFSSF